MAYKKKKKKKKKSRSVVVEEVEAHPKIDHVQEVVDYLATLCHHSRRFSGCNLQGFAANESQVAFKSVQHNQPSPSPEDKAPGKVRLNMKLALLKENTLLPLHLVLHSQHS